jgi:DNA topoisomerase-1
MTLTEIPSIAKASIAQAWRITRGNPLAGLVPSGMTQAINEFELGYLRRFALIFDRLEEGANMDIAAVVPKRRASVSALDYEIVRSKTALDDNEAKRHQAALQFLFENLTVRNAVIPEDRGEVRALVNNILRAEVLRYDVHEIVWQPGDGGLTCQLWHAPIACFENASGPLRYCGPSGGVGGVPLDEENWLIAVGGTLGVGMAVAHMIASLTLKDLLEYNSGFGLPGIHAESAQGTGTEEWNAIESALAYLPARFRIITGPGSKINEIGAHATGNAMFQPLRDDMRKAIYILALGSNLGTSSEHNQQGASLQANDTADRVENSARFVEDTINRRLVRNAIAQIFGEGVQPQAWFKLKVPARRDDVIEIQKDTFLIGQGVPFSQEGLAEKYAHSLPSKAETLIEATAKEPDVKQTKPTVEHNNAFDPDLHPRDITGKFAEKGSSGKGTDAKRGTMRKGTDEDRKKFGIAPAFKDIEVTDDPSADLLWTARDDKGRRKYGYSDAYSESQAAAKFARIGALHKAMPKLREQINEDIALAGDDLHQALTLRLISKTGLRNGGEGGGGDVKAYGASSLLSSHARVDGDKVHLDFVGKEGIRQRHSFNDKILAKHIAMRQRMGNETIFDGSADETLGYMKKISGDKFKVHDMRTWYGTTNADVITKKLIERGERPKTEKELKSFKKRVAGIVARDLGNGASMALNNYIHPLVFADVERGVMSRAKEAAR